MRFSLSRVALMDDAFADQFALKQQGLTMVLGITSTIFKERVSAVSQQQLHDAVMTPLDGLMQRCGSFRQICDVVHIGPMLQQLHTCNMLKPCSTAVCMIASTRRLTNIPGSALQQENSQPDGHTHQLSSCIVCTCRGNNQWRPAGSILELKNS